MGTHPDTVLSVPPVNPQKSSSTEAINREELRRQIEELGDWFHNLNLYGVFTAPNHFLGDFPTVKWKSIAKAIPEDLTGASVLDIGCNGGFYSIAMKQRGAERVLGVDIDDRYLNQARFAASKLGLEIEFEKRSVYEIDGIRGQFDYVFFMGVFYHLRYPVYALDKVAKKVGGRLVFQTMIRGSMEERTWEENYEFWNTKLFRDPDFPCLYFIEHKYADDPTNWFIPNRGAVEAILRSSGLELLGRPEAETWICAPKNVQRDGKYILDLELDGTL